MQVTLVTEVVSLTEASPVHMRAEGGAPLVTVTRPRTPGPPAALLTRHTVPGDMVTLQTRATPTLAPTVTTPAPLPPHDPHQRQHFRLETASGQGVRQRLINLTKVNKNFLTDHGSHEIFIT